MIAEKEILFSVTKFSHLSWMYEKLEKKKIENLSVTYSVAEQTNGAAVFPFVIVSNLFLRGDLHLFNLLMD